MQTFIIQAILERDEKRVEGELMAWKNRFDCKATTTKTISDVTGTAFKMPPELNFGIAHEEVRLTVMTAAAFVGDLRIFQLINKYVPPKYWGIECLDIDGFSPLSKAAMFNPGCIPFLVENGAGVNHPHAHDNTALHIAVHNRKCEAAQQLLKAGANITAQNKGGRTPLHVLILAISTDSTPPELAEIEWLPMVKILLNAQPDLELQDNNGEPPRDYLPNNNKYTVLMLAVKRGFVKIATLILQAGANPDTQLSCYYDDIDKRYLSGSAFQFAKDDPRMLRTLYSSKLVLSLSEPSPYPIFNIVLNGYKDSCDIHFPHKGITVHAALERDQKNADGLQRSLLLMQHGLVLEEKSDPPTREKYLRDSLQKGRSYTVRFLLSTDAAARFSAKAPTYLDDRVLNTAIPLNDVVREATQYCDLATVWPVDVTALQPTPSANAGGDVKGVAAGDVKQAVPPVVIKANPIFLSLTAESETLLHVAAQYGCLSNANYLLAQGVDVNHADRNGKTAIYLAAEKCNSGMLQLFCEHSSLKKPAVFDVKPINAKYSILAIAILNSANATDAVKILELLHKNGYVLHPNDVQAALIKVYPQVLLKMLELYSEQQKMVANTKTRDHWTPIYLVVTRIEASVVRSEEITKVDSALFAKLALVEHTPETLLTIPNDKQYRLLARAVRAGLNVDYAKALVKMGAVIDEDVVQNIYHASSGWCYLDDLFWDSNPLHCAPQTQDWNEALFIFLIKCGFKADEKTTHLINIVLPRILPLIDVNATQKDGSTYLHAICRNSGNYKPNGFIKVIYKTKKPKAETLYKKIPAPKDHNIREAGKDWNALCFALYTHPAKGNDEFFTGMVQIFIELGMDHDFEQALAIAKHRQLEKTIAALEQAIRDLKLKSPVADAKTAAAPVVRVAAVDVKSHEATDAKEDVATTTIRVLIETNLKTTTNNETNLMTYLRDAINYGDNEDVLAMIEKIKAANAYSVFLKPWNGKIALQHLLTKPSLNRPKLATELLDVMPQQQLQLLSYDERRTYGMFIPLQPKLKGEDLFDFWKEISHLAIPNVYWNAFISIFNNDAEAINKIKALLKSSRDPKKLVILQGILHKIGCPIDADEKAVAVVANTTAIDSNTTALDSEAAAPPSIHVEPISADKMLRQLALAFYRHQLAYFPDSSLAEKFKAPIIVQTMNAASTSLQKTIDAKAVADEKAKANAAARPPATVPSTSAAAIPVTVAADTATAATPPGGLAIFFPKTPIPASITQQFVPLPPGAITAGTPTAKPSPK